MVINYHCHNDERISGVSAVSIFPIISYILFGGKLSAVAEYLDVMAQATNHINTFHRILI